MITAIVLGILDRLKLAGEAGLLGYEFATREVYPREWESVLVAAPNVYPGAWCQFARFNARDQARSGARVAATFEMVVAAQHAGNLTKARDGDGPAKPGSIQLMEDVIGLLQGENLGLEISPIEVTSGEMASLPDDTVKQGVSVCVMQFTTDFIFPRGKPYFSPTGEFIGDLKTIHTDWGRPLPDATVDLTTDTTLPIQEEA